MGFPTIAAPRDPLINGGTTRSPIPKRDGAWECSGVEEYYSWPQRGCQYYRGGFYPSKGSLFYSFARKLRKSSTIPIRTPAKREPLSGHSLRIGGTLEYLLRGIDFPVVRVKGRWASETAFTGYLREHGQILAPYMQANPELQNHFIRLAMPPVR